MKSEISGYIINRGNVRQKIPMNAWREPENSSAMVWKRMNMHHSYLHHIRWRAVHCSLYYKLDCLAKRLVCGRIQKYHPTIAAQVCESTLPSEVGYITKPDQNQFTCTHLLCFSKQSYLVQFSLYFFRGPYFHGSMSLSNVYDHKMNIY